jgi:hypothetical protein
VEVLSNFSTGYHSRNGGGDRIETDGDLPVVDLSELPDPTGTEVAAQPEEAGSRRPPQVVFGALVAGLLGVQYLVVLALLIIPTPGDVDTGTLVAVGIGLGVGVLALVNLGLAAALLAGQDWPRILLCASSVLSIVFAYLGNAAGTERISLDSNLFAVAVSVLALLALSSEPARAYAEARRSRRKSGKGSPTGP